MADVTVGGLDAAATPLLPTDLLIVSRGGTQAKKVLISALMALLDNSFTGDASDVPYSPDDSGDWDNVPTDVQEALDELALVLGDGGATLRAPRIQSVTSSATVTPTFSSDQVNITAQAAGLTLANWSGTAIPAFGMVIRIKDNGTARSITYGSNYRAIGVTLPTTTVISKTLYLGCIYNSTDTKIDVVAVAQEA